MLDGFVASVNRLPTTRHDMITEAQDPVFEGEWTPKKLAFAYSFFQIKDEPSICPCGKITPRTFDGKCWSCHFRNFTACGRQPCPPLP